MKPMSQEECAAFVGLDWADAKHDVCLQAAGTARREFGVLEHSPEAIDVWVHPLPWALSASTGPVCPPCAHMLSWGSVLSTRSRWLNTVKHLPPAVPKTTPPMPNSRSRSSSDTTTSSPPSPPKPHHARLGATCCVSSAPRRRQSPSHQSPDQGAQKRLPPGPEGGG